MKVLRVIARLNTGGPARHVVVLNRGLDERGHQTLLVHGHVGDGEGSLEGLAREAGIRTTQLPQLGRGVHILNDCRTFLQLVQLVFNENPDVIHTHTAKAGALGRLAGLAFNLTRPRSRRALVVHTFHGHVFTGYFGRGTSALVRAVERSLATITDRVVTISPAQRRDVVDRFGVAPATRTVVIPLGLDLQPLLSESTTGAAGRREWGIDDHDVVVGYVGRFVPIKDLRTLIDAFAILARAVPRSTLLMAGDGHIRGELEAQVQRLGLRDRVRFLGWATNLPALYATFDICALSSLNEGTPVALIEAMAAGKAVVATNVGGVCDVVDEGVTGLLVPAGDARAMAGAFESLVRDPDVRQRMGRAGRQRAAERFTSGRLVDDIDRLYSSALAERRGTSPT